MSTSEIARLEKYLQFHLAEILEELEGSDQAGSDADPTWIFSKPRLLQSSEEIRSALARIRDGTYGNCAGCGQEIGLESLRVVPWRQFCDICQEDREGRVSAGSMVVGHFDSGHSERDRDTAEIDAG